MKTVLRILGLSIVATLFSACALLSQFTGADQDARYTAKVALTAYADFIQPAILTYGHLPDCNPAPKPLCKDHTAWVKIKALEATASSSVAAAGDVLASGTDITKINQAITDIDAVQTAWIAAKEAK